VNGIFGKKIMRRENWYLESNGIGPIVFVIKLNNILLPNFFSKP